MAAEPDATFDLDAATRLDDTLLFDRASGAATNLGRGFRGSFSPDSTRMAGVRITSEPTGEVRLIDLETGDQQRLGHGVDSAPWIDDQTVLSVDEGARNGIVIDVESGQRELAPSFDPPDEPFASQLRGDLKLVRITRRLPFVFELRRVEDGAVLMRFECRGRELRGRPATGARDARGRRHAVLEHLPRGRRLGRGHVRGVDEARSAAADRTQRE